MRELKNLLNQRSQIRQRPPSRESQHLPRRLFTAPLISNFRTSPLPLLRRSALHYRFQHLTLRPFRGDPLPPPPQLGCFQGRRFKASEQKAKSISSLGAAPPPPPPTCIFPSKIPASASGQERRDGPPARSPFSEQQ